MANEYADLETLKSFIGVNDTSSDSILAVILESASRAIDTYCDRRFYKDAETSTRVYSAYNRVRVRPDDIADPDSIVVKTDPTGAGDFTQEWSRSGTAGFRYTIEPVNASALGRPVTDLVVTGAFYWPAGIDRVQVTAKWGWPNVPTDVELACLEQAASVWNETAPASGGTPGVASVSLEGSDSITFAGHDKLLGSARSLRDTVRERLADYRRLITP